LSTVIYTETFANANFGYGAALSLVFTVLVLAAARSAALHHARPE
jgi:ABC-type sugar transport system permease subunit